MRTKRHGSCQSLFWNFCKVLIGQAGRPSGLVSIAPIWASLGQLRVGGGSWVGGDREGDPPHPNLLFLTGAILESVEKKGHGM